LVALSRMKRSALKCVIEWVVWLSMSIIVSHPNIPGRHKYKTAGLLFYGYIHSKFWPDNRFEITLNC
jgi:hypothetical protein